MNHDPYVSVSHAGGRNSPAPAPEELSVGHQALSPRVFEGAAGPPIGMVPPARGLPPWTMDRPEGPPPAPKGLVRGISRKRLLQSVVLVGAVYVLARTDGWVGPGAHREMMPELLWPAVIVIGLWGLSRVLRDEP